MAKKAEKAKLAKKAAKQQRKTLKAKKTLTKTKKKKWVPMFAPPFFAEQTLGDCFVEEAEGALGRKLKVSMMNLTRETRKQAISVSFEAVQTKGAGVQTAICGYEMAHNATKRLVRKNRTKVADSFLIKSKDKKVVRVKPYIVARNRIPASLQTKMRLLARELLAREGARQSFQKFMEDVIQGKTQKALKVNLQKLYPLSACELRQVVIERSETPLELGETVMELPKRKPRRTREKKEEKKAPAKEEKAKPAKEEAAKEESEKSAKKKSEKKEAKSESTPAAKESPKEAVKA